MPNPGFWTHSQSTEVLERQEEEPESAIRPYLNVFEGGVGGELYEELIDFFYYCQLRAQGEGTREERKVTGRITLAEVPWALRAVGVYPSELELSHIINEMKGETHFSLSPSQ